MVYRIWIVVNGIPSKVEKLKRLTGVNYITFNKSVDIFLALFTASLLSRFRYNEGAIFQHNVFGVTLHKRSLFYAYTFLVQVAIHPNLFGGVDVFQHFLTGVDKWLDRHVCFPFVL